MSSSPRVRRSRAGLLTLPILLFGLAFTPATQGQDEAPASVQGAANVDAEGLIALVQERGDLVLIDSRISANRKHGFIEGSLSLPDVATDCNTLASHIATPSTPVLFYCNGPNCLRSSNAVTIARECGYQTLYWFRGGFLEWKQKGYAYLKE